MRKIRKGQSGLSFMSGVTPSPPSTITQSIPSLQHFNFKFQLPSDSNVAMQTLDPNAMSTDPLQDTISKIIPQYNLQNPTEQQGQDFSFQLSSPESMLKQSVRDQSSTKENQTNAGSWINSSNMQSVGNIADAFDSFIPKKEQSGLTTGLNSFYDQLSNKVGPIAGGFMKAAGLVSDGLTALGVGTDQMTTTDKILDSKFLKATPIGLINSIGGKKSDTIYKNNQAFEQVGSSYTGTNAFVDDAVKKSGKKYGLFSSGARKKANEQIGEANRQQNIVSGISDNAVRRFNIQSSMSDILNNRYGLSLQGGMQFNNIHSGRNGMKILDKKAVERAKTLVKSISNETNSDDYQLDGITEPILTGFDQLQETFKYKDGGKMNVIPDGALHARLNHMDVNNITKKGIPVVSKEDGGELQQQAEIERNEIIFTKEVTNKLEQLYKDGSDKAAIEAGKLLATEIIENTQDNTGLMQEVV